MPFMYILHILYICVPNLAYYLTFLNQILVHFTINSNKGFIKNKLKIHLATSLSTNNISPSSDSDVIM